MKTKLGRPELPEEEQLKSTGFRLYPHEKARLSRLAKAQNLSRGRFVAQLLANQELIKTVCK